MINKGVIINDSYDIEIGVIILDDVIVGNVLLIVTKDIPIKDKLIRKLI